MFLDCFWYLFGVSVIGFFVGRILPKEWFDPSLFPYKPHDFENGGKYYDKFKIRKWQNKLPDMSKIFKKIMPPKQMSRMPSKEELTLMLQETCIAEWEHKTVLLLGLYCIFIWQGMGGIIVSLLYTLGNIPFIIIQRYNRPKLMRVLAHITKEPVGECQMETETEVKRCVS